MVTLCQNISVVSFFLVEFNYIVLYTFYMITGQVKLCVHTMRLCQLAVGGDSDDYVGVVSLLDLLHFFKSPVVFNNEFLRHHLFCIFQVLAGRSVSFTFSARLFLHVLFLMQCISFVFHLGCLWVTTKLKDYIALSRY